MPSPLDIDAVFVEIGEMGPQQIKYVLGIGLLNAYGAWHMLQHTFVGYDVPFRYAHEEYRYIVINPQT
jgi:hypothetical protein